MMKSIRRRAKREKHVTFEYTGDNDEDIPSNVTNVRILSGVSKIEDTAFINRVRLVSITFPSTTDTIMLEAFYHCNSLREVALNEGIKTIGFDAFFHCKSLESITIPSTVNEIGQHVFESCINLRTVVLNEGLKKIDGFAFASCTSLQSITLPSTITAIRSYAFTGCDRLREIVILNPSANDIINNHHIIRQVMVACISVRKLNFPNLSARLENISKIDHWSNVIGDKIDEIPQIVRIVVVFLSRLETEETWLIGS